MKIHNINLKFGEANYIGTIVTTGSLNNSRKTILLGKEFTEDVFEFARKKAKLPKDFNMKNIISTGDLFKLTDISSIKDRKAVILNMLAKQGLLKK